MTAVTVSDWALKGTLLDHIVGDILHTSRSMLRAPKQLLHPGMYRHIIRGLTSFTKLWRTGAAMVATAGGLHAVSGPQDPLSALYTRVDATLPSAIVWENDRGLLDLTELLGDELMSLRVALHHTTGPPSLEWLPTAPLWYVMRGPTPPPYPSFPYGGNITPHSEVQRAFPPDHPLGLQLLPGYQDSTVASFQVTAAGTDPGSIVTVSLSGELVQHMRNYGGAEVQVTALHPYPSLSRMRPHTPAAPMELGSTGSDHASVLLETMGSLPGRNRGHLHCSRESVIEWPAPVHLHWDLIPSTSSALDGPKAKAARLCYSALMEADGGPPTLPSTYSGTSQIVLLFDGGSRGNPGPGGGGTVIASVGATQQETTIIWMTSVSYASKATNNVAEYNGLLNGLRYASRHQLVGLHVVGDSKLIFTQLQHRKPVISGSANGHHLDPSFSPTQQSGRCSC
ncbi:unnamed protein product [Phytophthora fragariaefolia]|uniref:Unnamed protein product n=1 Tax=Phytophthora fragariaefolia TaxID=1490495 RepID=A0A9W6XXU5_9STRA|nr:unnamed protein product [Phytophthora fragariaefolia]